MNYATARRNMVERQVVARGVTDLQVLNAMREVPRHLFIEEALRAQAYSDAALPIGERQTISQPYTVASMTAALCLQRHDHVLEIGTGSGYQSAILARIVRRVLSIERIPELARQARRVLDATGCGNVQIRVGDGTLGWPEEAPFDAIIVTAGAPAVPEEYRQQLAIGGRLIIPVGDRGGQVLKRVVRTGADSFSEESFLDCRFVPLLGVHGWGSVGGGE